MRTVDEGTEVGTEVAEGGDGRSLREGAGCIPIYFHEIKNNNQIFLFLLFAFGREKIR